MSVIIPSASTVNEVFREQLAKLGKLPQQGMNVPGYAGGTYKVTPEGEKVPDTVITEVEQPQGFVITPGIIILIIAVIGLMFILPDLKKIV